MRYIGVRCVLQGSEIYRLVNAERPVQPNIHMMQSIKSYSFFYRPEDDSGSVHFALENGEGADVFTDSAAESAFLLDLLSKHGPCFWNAATGQISTGIEPVEGGEA